MTRTGRPLKPDARKRSLTLRLTDRELADIQTVADAMGISRTDAIMKGIALLKESLETK